MRLWRPDKQSWSLALCLLRFNKEGSKHPEVFAFGCFSQTRHALNTNTQLPAKTLKNWWKMKPGSTFV